MPETTNQQNQPVGIKANPYLRTKEGYYLSPIKFATTNCKFLVLKGYYDNGLNKTQECYLTCNFTNRSTFKGICIHLFDSINPQGWKIDNWSKAVQTKLNVLKLRQPTEDEKELIDLLKKNLAKEQGIVNIFLAKPNVVESETSLNNPKTGTNSANKQNNVDTGLAKDPKQPNAAVQGVVEGLAEKNPALESTKMVFDNVIRENKLKENFMNYKVIFENENFSFVEGMGTIRTKCNGENGHSPRHYFKVMTRDGSKADDCVVSITIDTYYPMLNVDSFETVIEENHKEVGIRYGHSLTSQVSIYDLIEVFKDAVDFAKKVADYLNIEFSELV